MAVHPAADQPVRVQGKRHLVAWILGQLNSQKTRTGGFCELRYAPAYHYNLHAFNEPDTGAPEIKEGGSRC